MIQTIKSRKGMTIAELIVALALVLVVLALVTSFLLILVTMSRNKTENQAIRDDCDAVKDFATAWMDDKVTRKAKISVDFDEDDSKFGGVILFKAEDTSEGDLVVHYLCFDENTDEIFAAVRGVNADGDEELQRVSINGTATPATTNVVNVEGYLQENGENQLLFLTITCEKTQFSMSSSSLTQEVSYTVCVNSRIAETTQIKPAEG